MWHCAKKFKHIPFTKIPLLCLGTFYIKRCRDISTKKFAKEKQKMLTFIGAVVNIAKGKQVKVVQNLRNSMFFYP